MQYKSDIRLWEQSGLKLKWDVYYKPENNRRYYDIDMPLLSNSIIALEDSQDNTLVNWINENTSIDWTLEVPHVENSTGTFILFATPSNLECITAALYQYGIVVHTDLDLWILDGQTDEIGAYNLEKARTNIFPQWLLRKINCDDGDGYGSSQVTVT